MGHKERKFTFFYSDRERKMAKNRGICAAHTCIPQYREYSLPPGPRLPRFVPNFGIRRSHYMFDVAWYMYSCSFPGVLLRNLAIDIDCLIFYSRTRLQQWPRGEASAEKQMYCCNLIIHAQIILCYGNSYAPQPLTLSQTYTRRLEQSTSYVIATVNF